MRAYKIICTQLTKIVDPGDIFHLLASPKKEGDADDFFESEFDDEVTFHQVTASFNQNTHKSDPYLSKD